VSDQRDDAPEDELKVSQAVLDLAGGGIPVRLLGCRLFTRRYKLSTWRLLGRGEAASVGEVFCIDKGEVVVVKAYKEPVPQERQERVRDEYRNSKAVAKDCPIILPIHDVFFEAEGTWFEMERDPGRVLKDLLVEHKGHPIDFERGRLIAVTLLEGLAAAHAANVVHRDIKPENILLPDSGNPPVRILDFGISRAGDAINLSLTSFGTPQYAPPEAWEGKKVGPAGDVYSAGLVLFQLFTGHFPWNEMDEEPPPERLYALHTRKAGDPLRPRYLVKPFPEELDGIIMDALEVDPTARPTPRQIINVLSQIPADPREWHEPARPYLPAKPKSGGPSKPLVISSAVLAALALVGTVVYFGRARPIAPEVSNPTTTVPAAVTVPPATIEAAPTAPPAHFAAVLENGSVLVSNVSGPALAGFTLTIPGTEHRCICARSLEPGRSRMLPAPCWAPPLGALRPTILQLEAQTPNGYLTETLRLGSGGGLNEQARGDNFSPTKRPF
jgi:serine/threonine-protein kinase